MVTDIRSEPTSIDGLWLTAALEESGIAKGAKVLDVTSLGSVGTGQAARTARLQLAWDDPAGRPSTVIGKFPSDDPAARAGLFGAGTYLKEFVFYNELVNTVEIRAPHCYLALFDAAAQEFVLLLEDIQDAVTGDQLDGLSVDQVALALGQAVKLHAPRWGDPALEGIVWRGQPAASVAESAAMSQAIFDAAVPGFLERLGGLLDDEIIDLVQRLRPKAGNWMFGAGTAKTLVHYDFRADNFLFGQHPDAAPLVVVDYQSLNIGVAASDVAYVIAGSLPDRTERAEVERGLVLEYHEQLLAAGVDITPDTLWRDYRFGSLWGVLMAVLASLMSERSERGERMLAAMAQRHGHHALDLDALDLLH